MFQNLIHQGGTATHLGMKLDTSRMSQDYFTAYIPLTSVVLDEELEEDTIKMNKAVQLGTGMKFGTPKGRALVSLNPKLKAYLKDINGDTILEPGESYTVEGKARKNLSIEELNAVLGSEDGWLYRVSILT